MDTTGNSVRLICEECFMKKEFCECPICKETKFLFSYYDHLIYKHIVQDLAKHMYETEKNSRHESW